MSIVTPAVRHHIEEGLRDPEGFWARAADALPWFRRWDRVFEWSFPTFRWFIGAETNLAWNALDRHVAEGRGGHTALVALDERGGRQTFTYAELRARVEAVAAALRALGIGRGDRLTIYMPTSGCTKSVRLLLAFRREDHEKDDRRDLSAGGLPQPITALACQLVVGRLPVVMQRIPPGHGL